MVNNLFKLAFAVMTLFCCGIQQLSAQFPQWHNYTSNTSVFDFEFDGNDIWICSTGGLVKFNKSTATHVNYNGGNFGMTLNEIFRIETDQSGNLFIAGSESVQIFDKDSLWDFTDTLAVAGKYMPYLNSCKPDKLGKVYASTSSDYIVRYNNSVFDTINLPFGNYARVGGIAIDSSNHLWVSSRYYGIGVYDGTNWQVFDSTNSILPAQYANGICIDNNNKIYALFFVPLSQGVLYSYSNGIWTLEQSGISMGNEHVEMYVDDINNIWITSEQAVVNGIIKYDGTNITSIVAGASGLPSNDINEFQIDDQGIWYYTTDLGFYSFDGVSHRKYELSNSGVPINLIENVVIDKHNVKWFASYHGVTRFDGYQWETFTVANSTLGWNHVTDIYADWDHELIWVTFNPGYGNSGIAYYDGSIWNTVTPTVSGGFHNGYSVTKDANGNMWFLGTSGVAKYDYNTWTFYDNGVLPTVANGNLVADSSGNVFVSAFGGGVWKCDGSMWQQYDSTYFVNSVNSLYHLFSGYGGQVCALNGLNAYTFDGTLWNSFTSPCVVQNPATFSPIETSTGELWLTNGEFTSMYDGNSCEEFTVSRLPDLSGVVKSVAKDLHNNYWFTYHTHGGVSVYHPDGGVLPESLFGTPTFNASGFVYIDVASDGVFDSITDIPYANQKLLLLPDSMIHFTNAQGMYNFSLDSGVYSLKVIQDSTWQLTTDSLEYHFTIAGFDTSGFDFGLMDPNLPNEQMVVEVTTGIPRCNTSFPVWIDYSNQGLNTQTGLIKFSLGNLLSCTGSNPPADSIDGNNLFWNITGLTTFHQGSIVLGVELDTFLLPTFLHTIQVEFLTTGVATASDILSFEGICSYDPNDKMVAPEGAGPLHEISPVQKLDYTIRFQNFGNDTAFYVMILDTLDADLDFSTFKIESSSHPCEVSLSSRGLLTVKYRSINLLWEGIDAAGSQGYFRFSIKPVSNIADNTVITNSAAIYFDYNLPVITNEVFNTISYNLTSINNNVVDDEIVIYPVPSSNEIYISGTQSNEMVSYTIFDIAGKQLSKELLRHQNQPVKISHLQSGIYFLRLKSVSGKFFHSRFLVNHQD